MGSVSNRRMWSSVATLVTLLLSAMVMPLDAQAPATQTATAPAGAPSATAAAAPTAAAAKPTRDSWTSDRRSFAVGDVITILIDDYTISTAVTENIATDTRTSGVAVTANLPTGSKGGGVDSRKNADQQQRGSARRENRFQNEMSVRVAAVGPGGLLQLKGTKKINVDKNTQDILMTGWARVQDISTQNVIESSRVADFQLGYAAVGSLGKPTKSMIMKLLGGVLP